MDTNHIIEAIEAEGSEALNGKSIVVEGSGKRSPATHRHKGAVSASSKVEDGGGAEGAMGEGEKAER